MNDLVTCDSILDWMKDQVEHKRPISPHLWLEAAQKLNILSSDENDKLIELEHQLAKVRAGEMDAGKTGIAAKVKVEASDIFKEARIQRARIKQIEEAIRLAKLSARIKNDEQGRNI